MQRHIEFFFVYDNMLKSAVIPKRYSLSNGLSFFFFYFNCPSRNFLNKDSRAGRTTLPLNVFYCVFIQITSSQLEAFTFCFDETNKCSKIHQVLR